MSFGETRATPAKAACPQCSRTVTKTLDAIEWHSLSAAIENNTTPEFPDEQNAETRSGIVKRVEDLAAKRPSPNDRLIYEWQKSAGHLDRKTVDAYLRAVRRFEDYLGVKPFADLTVDDCASFREHLKDLQSKGQLSTSSVRHVASQVTKFLEWVVAEPAGKSLNRNITTSLQLPKKFNQPGIERERPYPTIDQAVEMLRCMPCETPHARLRKALFALICMTGLRADAATTLRRCDIDLDARTVRQDARHARAKNGKSFVVHWFPVPDDFAAAVTSYVNELDAFGLRPDDALFPLDADLKMLLDNGRSSGTPFKARRSSKVATEAFAAHGNPAFFPYSPHSARDMLVALGSQLCTTSEQHKAWSQNLGHDDIVTTERYYGRMDAQRVGATLASIGSKDNGSSEMVDTSGANIPPNLAEILMDLKNEVIALNEKLDEIQQEKDDFAVLE